MDIIFVHIGFPKTQLGFKRFPDYINVSVLAEYHRDDQPVIGNSYLPVRPVITVKGLVPPPGDIRRCPTKCLRLAAEPGCFVFHILCGNRSARGNRRQGFTNGDTVHPDFFFRRNIADHKLVFCWYVCREG